MRKIFKIMTDNGPRYVALHWEYDFFFTPAYADIKHTAAAFGWSKEVAQEDAATHVFDMRSSAIDRMEHGVARLQAGHSLEAADALVVDCMYDFLHATVAPHQRNFRFLSDELLERWVQDLGLRAGRMSKWDTDCIVNDGALWPAVHRPCQELKYPDQTSNEPRTAPTKSQNILAGRYLRTLAQLGKLIGPDRMSPEDIVAAWAGKNREKASGPSMLDAILEILASSPNVQLLSAPSNVMWPATNNVIE